MRGSAIPKTTQYIIQKNVLTTSKKVPMYELKPAKEIKAHQDSLDKNAGWYYGTDCKKCCGVYPAFFTEQTFDSKGYYVCLVCGKESKHEVMPWIAAREWNRGNFIFDPQAENYQMTIFDILGGG